MNNEKQNTVCNPQHTNCPKTTRTNPYGRFCDSLKVDYKPAIGFNIESVEK